MPPQLHIDMNVCQMRSVNACVIHFEKSLKKWRREYKLLSFGISCDFDWCAAVDLIWISPIYEWHRF